MKLRAYIGKTDKGPYLEVNEDLFDVDLSQNLFMMIDAFGGAGQGDVCAEKIVQHMKEMYSRISRDPDSTLPFFYGPQYLLEGNALINATLSTHNLICQDNRGKQMSQRAGASGVFLSFSENIVNILSVGTCQTYHYSGGKLQKVYQEDSLHLTNPIIKQNVKVPLNAFGLYDYLHFILKEVKMSEGDYLILMTDGAHHLLDEDEIKAIVEKNTVNLSNAISEMFFLANKRNNLDNQSGMILSF